MTLETVVSVLVCQLSVRKWSSSERAYPESEMMDVKGMNNGARRAGRRSFRVYVHVLRKGGKENKFKSKIDLAVIAKSLPRCQWVQRSFEDKSESKT